MVVVFSEIFIRRRTLQRPRLNFGHYFHDKNRKRVLSPRAERNLSNHQLSLSAVIMIKLSLPYTWPEALCRDSTTSYSLKEQHLLGLNQINFVMGCHLIEGNCQSYSLSCHFMATYYFYICHRCPECKEQKSFQ